MCKRIFSALVTILLMVCFLFSLTFSVAALDNKYTIDELKLSIKIPKDYTVITRTLQSDDDAFSKLNLDYTETMTAFSAADIYLQATSEDSILKVTLTQTSDENTKAVNNYSQLSSAERQQVLDAFMQNPNYTSGVEIKHNGIIYFDMGLTQQTVDSSIYCFQCHTVVNGMNINLTLQKNDEELTPDEIKVVTNMANTITFDKIKTTSGPSFEWWRFLLWIVILVVLALLAKYFYAQYNNSRTERPKRVSRVACDDDMSEEDILLSASSPYRQESGNMDELLTDIGLDEEDDLSFDEVLGYDTTDYQHRSNIELDSFDIKVKPKDEKSGVQYFEDNGRSINDEKDYFDDFFSQETENRPAHKRFFSNAVLYVKLMFRHIRYFFKNLSKSLGKNSSHKR